MKSFTKPFMIILLIWGPSVWMRADGSQFHEYQRSVTWHLMGKTDRGQKGTIPQMQVLLVFTNYPHHHVSVFSNILADFLKEKGQAQVTLLIRESPKFTKFTVAGWEVPSDVQWNTGTGCGEDHLAPCDDWTGKYSVEPSPWEPR